MGSFVAFGGTESLFKSCLHLLDDLRLVSNLKFKSHLCQFLDLFSCKYFHSSLSFLQLPGTHSIPFLSILEQREFLWSGAQ